MESANLKNHVREKVKKKLRGRIRQRLLEQKFERDLESFVGIQAAKVGKVHVDGLCKTQDWLVRKTVAELLQVNTFGDVLFQTKNTQLELAKLGCFQTVNALIGKDLLICTLFL